ncbi:MAG: carbon storage regulator [Desulfobacterales bacterium RIFOXYA12_FULL_46_15]|nr:MAG: carbon storage regulator [Desulfobacterales bacterium RIFOXYA12_FULL_46_15]
MLVLTRRPGEKIKIGNNIVVSVLEIEGGYIKLGVEAPKDISILRMEVFEKIQKENIESASKDIRDIADAAALIKKKFSRSK